MTSNNSPSTSSQARSSHSPATTHDATASSSTSGFRSFWRKARQRDSDSPAELTFVTDNVPAPKKGQKLKSLLNRLSDAPSPSANANLPHLTNAQRRRLQIYEAQKRHRDRKTNYVETLEAELTQLQHLDAEARRELNKLTTQNLAIKRYLLHAGLDAELSPSQLSPEPGTIGTALASGNTSRSSSGSGSATVDVHYDGDVGHRRTFLSAPLQTGSVLPESEGGLTFASEPALATGGESSDLGAIPPAIAPLAPPAPADAWVALDFILALEWPCQDHTGHHEINPCGNNPGECESGHALTMTSAVYQSAFPAGCGDDGVASATGMSLPVAPASGAGRWELPYAEIDKLITLSNNLAIDTQQITPAQAFAAIRQAVAIPTQLPTTLDLMKPVLGALVHCLGFGAAIPAETFWQVLEEAVPGASLAAVMGMEGLQVGA